MPFVPAFSLIMHRSSRLAAAAAALILSAFAVIIAGIAIGSVYIPPGQFLDIIANKFFGTPLENAADGNISNIVFSIRIPRSLIAFLTGASLSCCGAAVQSVLKNPLASPFTLGVSSGASLGAGLVIASGVAFMGGFTLAFAGLSFGIVTMLFMVAFSSAIDKSMQSSTVILTGMVLSLFISSVVTLLANVRDEKYKQIMKWQTGSFAGRGYEYVFILSGVLIISFIFFMTKTRELDGMSFGDEHAQAVGIESRKTKISVLVISAVLSGTAVSFTGVIGFVDLISPHIARRLFGANHKILIPASAFIGGIFTVICDLAARTVIAPGELPVGVVTSIIGAPFFAAVFFKRHKK